MTKKVQKILLIIFLTALIVALMATSFLYASTYGRYSGGALSDDSTYDDTIEFVGAEQFVVYTPEELIEAIENGYSYIQIADNAESPFVITTGVQDVSTNLVLDLNGTVVVRNSRNPMLDVGQGVSIVLVYDSSEEQTGAFYNPVGSALQVSGGTMTVGSGSYESGPRESEDGANQNEEGYQGASLDGFGSDGSVWLYARDESYTEKPATVDRSGSQYHRINGTVAGYVPRIDKNYYRSSGNTPYKFLTPDTFLIYTREEGIIADENSSFAPGTLLVEGRPLTVPCNVASCDFYYYYPTGERAENGTDIYAVVYGYWDVKELAENGSSLRDSGLQWPYASIRMDAGQGFVRGGTFDNHFGLDYTYGIFTQGGTLTVSGTPATTKFSAVDNGICIGCAGGGLLISGGEFASDMGDTIRMQNGDLDVNGGTFSVGLGYIFHITGGEMDVTAGSFTKNAAGGATGEGENNGAAISMQDGALTIAGTQTDTKSVQFTVTGSYVNGIEAAGGTINAENFSMQLKGSHCKGIYANIANSVAEGAYDVTVSDADITVGEAVNNDGNFGIHMNNGYILCSDLTLDVYGTNSAGVLAVVENAIAGRANVVLTGTYRGTIHQSGTTELSSAAVILQGGHIDLRTDAPEQEDEYNITSDGFGIVVEGGNISQSEGSLSVNTTRGTAIYLRGGSLTQAGNATLSVTSAIADNIQWAQEEGDNSGDGTASIYNGVYVRGGSLTANGTLDVTHTGVENDTTQIVNNDSVEAFTEFEITSFAIRVQGAASTRVAINAGNITNTIGGGLNVSGGEVFLGNQTGNTVSISTTGTDTTGKIHWYGGANNWDNEISVTGGHAVDVQDGDLTIYNGTYSAEKGEGVLVRNGTVTIENGVFSGRDGESHAGPAASYALKMYGGTASISGGTFGGSGSGAFITGTAANAVATAKITGGTFEVDGQGGFSVFEYANVTFDPAEGKTISVSGEAAGLILEGVGLQANGTTVTIRGGTFKSTATSGGTSEFGNALWNGNRLATLEISGGSFDGLYAAFSIPYGVQAGGSVTISGGTFTGDRRGISFEGALNVTHAVVISGGTFEGGEYGIYYGVDGENANDGLLIEGGTFRGTGTGSYGFFFADNPWSAGDWGWPDTNNVAIIGGTFSGKTRSIGTSNEHDDIAIGDVLTEHVGNNSRYGVAYKSDGTRRTVVDRGRTFYIDGSEGAGTTASGSINLMPDEVTLTTEPKTQP